MIVPLYIFSFLLFSSWRVDFIIFSLIGSLLFFYYKYLHIKKEKTSDIWKIYNEMAYEKVIINSHIYNIHKGPRKIKYIMMHENVKNIFEDLYFILNFQPDLLIDIIIYMEYFLKFHYNIMIEKYDACTYIPILKDIQKQILNLLSTSVFNLPKYSKTLDIPNIDVFLNSKFKDLNAITFKYMQILRHKFKCFHKFDFNENDPISSPYQLL